MQICWSGVLEKEHVQKSSRLQRREEMNYDMHTTELCTQCKYQMPMQAGIPRKYQMPKNSPLRCIGWAFQPRRALNN